MIQLQRKQVATPILRSDYMKNLDKIAKVTFYFSIGFGVMFVHSFIASLENIVRNDLNALDFYKTSFGVSLFCSLVTLHTSAILTRIIYKEEK